MNGFIHSHCSRGGSRRKKSRGHGHGRGTGTAGHRERGRALADCPSWGVCSLGQALGTTWEHVLLVNALWRECDDRSKHIQKDSEEKVASQLNCGGSG